VDREAEQRVQPLCRPLGGPLRHLPLHRPGDLRRQQRDGGIRQRPRGLEGEPRGARLQGRSSRGEKGGGQGGTGGRQRARRQRRAHKEKEDKNDKWHRVERSSGKFVRRFRLPEDAKVEEVKAGLENGVLTVTVPKAEVKKPEVKAIEISG
ncbi:hypothetical protein CFC21_045050, partial [Triticum aestivum]